MAVPPGFTVLSSNVSVYSPDRKDTSILDDYPDSQAPDLVIICSWVNANVKHITKYTSAWQKIAPQADIVLTQSSIGDMTWRSLSAQHQNLQPAVEIIKTRLGQHYKTAEASASSDRKPRIVIHIFSHGGSNNAIQLIRCVLSDGPFSIGDLNLHSFILDSTPGSSDYSRSLEAVRFSMPKSGPLLYLGLLAAHVTLTSSYIAVYLGLSTGIEHLRAELLDQGIFPKGMQRVYLYSKADRMVDWRLVKQHAEEAEARGWEVEQRCFENSPHCGHVREDEEGYWNIIRSSWGT